MVLSLQRMNRILEVNEKLTYIVVEPGVTFFDVYDYFQKHNLDLWISVPALGWGSLVGNVIRRHLLLEIVCWPALTSCCRLSTAGMATLLTEIVSTLSVAWRWCCLQEIFFEQASGLCLLPPARMLARTTLAPKLTVSFSKAIWVLSRNWQ